MKGNKDETIINYTGEYKTAGEYAEALRSWMIQFYQFQCVSASFPYFLVSLQAQVSEVITSLFIVDFFFI